jgi:ABC-2 type transport system permease protein
MMRGTWIICRKELNSYFASPIAYSVMALFAFIFGFFFYEATTYFMQVSMESQMQGRGFPMNINEMIVRPVLGNMSVIALFLLPMLAMRIFAEEKRSGTMELLVTSPVSDTAIVIGKWLGAFILYASIVLVGALSILFLFLYGKPDWKPVLIGLLGLILQGASLLALGAWLSSMTKNQIVAGVAGFVLFLFLWVVGWGSEFDTTWWGQFRGYLSATNHVETFSKGIIDSKDVVYYLSLTFLGLFLANRSLESLRWRS